MKSTLRFRLGFSVAAVVVAYSTGWLLTGSGSPFRDYFLHNVGVPNAWRALNVVPLILGLLVSGNPHAQTGAGVVVTLAAFVAQWALVGFVLSKPLLNLGRTLR